MKIGIDARALQTSHRFRGIGSYAANLIENIASLDLTNEYVFFSQGNNEGLHNIKFPEKFRYEEKFTKNVQDPSRYNWYFDQFFLPKAINHSKVKVIHFLDQLSAPIVKAAKTVITVNDLMQFHGQESSWKNKVKIQSITSADKIIAISEYTKKDIIKHFQISKDRIKVIYDGYDEKYFRPADDQLILKEIRKKILGKEDEHYLFYSGSFEHHEPRKNVDFLLDILEELDKRNFKKINIVLSGKEGEESKRLKAEAAKLSLTNRLIFVGFLTKEELVHCYQAALAFVFPSLGEGFGLPPLEAMACGCPVVSSNISSLPEVVGEAGIMISPNDPKLWATAIEKISNNHNYRQTLINSGFKQAKKFSWKKCAQETIETYKEVANDKN